MTKISYWENKNTMMFKQDEGYDFINPAEQNVVRNLGGQLWKPTFASRSDFPMWDRKIFSELLIIKILLRLSSLYLK